MRVRVLGAIEICDSHGAVRALGSPNQRRVLAALVRCTLASLDHHVRRAELEASASGQAHGLVTKRVEDGLYALVEVDVRLEVEVAPAPAPDAVRELLARVERGCFVGNSLTAGPRYHWTVNGEAASAT